MTKQSTNSPKPALRDLIANDSFAAAFQTMGQYRGALLKHDAMERAQHAESFAWAVFAENGNVIIWSKNREQVEIASAKYGRPVVPVIALSAVQQAAAPGTLDADEMTRLRRLMRALGHSDAFELDNEYVRGVMCTLLGQAAGKLESSLGTPEAPDTRRLDLLLRSDGFRFELMNQQQHLLDPRGRIAGKGFTNREAIDDALGVQRAAQLDGGQGDGK